MAGYPKPIVTEDDVDKFEQKCPHSPVVDRFEQKCPHSPVFGHGGVPMVARSSGMLDDIFDTPAVMHKLITENLSVNGDSHVNIPTLNKPLPSTHRFAGKTGLDVISACRAPDGSFKNNITIVGCGTSYHAAILAEYLIEQIARIPVEVLYASEYRYKELLHREGDVLITVSSSGETLDTLECLKALKKSPMGDKVLTLAIVNETNSSLAKQSDVFIPTRAGDEVGIASTKVFSAMALSFVLLAISLAEKCGTLKQAEKQQLLKDLKELPELVQKVLDKEASALRPKSQSDSPKERTKGLKIGECKLWDIGCQNVLAGNFIFLGRGLNFPIALEGAMKCKELAYIHAEGYPAAEMKHGPIALIDQFMPVVVICPRSDPCYEKIKSNIEEVVTRSGSVIGITEDTNKDLEKICEHVITVPCTHEYLMPLIAAIPMQLLAYMMGTLRGNEVDNPRGLSKVTV